MSGLPGGPQAGRGTDAVLREVDRFLVPAAPGPVRYFVDRLFVAHGRRERWRWAVARALGPGAARLLLTGRAWTIDPTGALEPRGYNGVPTPWDEAGELLADLASWPAGAPAADLMAASAHGRAILLRDYTEGRRAGLLLFPFPEAGEEPEAVIKARRSGAAHPLRHENAALHAVRKTLPPELARTVPAPRACRSEGPLTALVLHHVPGRSAYVDMRNARSPDRLLDQHFTVAAHWLAGFHEATRSGRSMEIGDGDAAVVHSASPPPGDGGSDWLSGLRRGLERRPVPLAMAHGDFWARNLLIRPATPATGIADRAVVVDWEHFRREGRPTDDLFHFPLSYAMTYRWHGYRPVGLSAAFRRTFLDRTPVAAAVRHYLAAYCSATDLDVDLLKPLLRLHLLHRAANDTDRAEAWQRCETLLAASDQPMV